MSQHPGFVDDEAADDQPGAAMGVFQLRHPAEGGGGWPLRAVAIVWRSTGRAELEELRAAIQCGLRPDRRREDARKGSVNKYNRNYTTDFANRYDPLALRCWRDGCCDCLLS
jgi:hypothetical protein